MNSKAAGKPGPNNTVTSIVSPSIEKTLPPPNHDQQPLLGIAGEVHILRRVAGSVVIGGLHEGIAHERAIPLKDLNALVAAVAHVQHPVVGTCIALSLVASDVGALPQADAWMWADRQAGRVFWKKSLKPYRWVQRLLSQRHA